MFSLGPYISVLGGVPVLVSFATTIFTLHFCLSGFIDDLLIDNLIMRNSYLLNSARITVSLAVVALNRHKP